MKRDWFCLPALGLLLCVAAPAARADCVSDCQASTYCNSEMNASGECGSRLNQCYRTECGRPSNVYGAIAYGAKSQAYGYAYDLPDTETAGRKAMANCQKHGDDCKVVATFTNSCAAVAAAGSSYAIAQGGSEKGVQNSAMSACRAQGGKNCEVQVWACASP